MRGTYDASYFEGFEAGYKLDRYKVWYWEVVLRHVKDRNQTFRASLDIGCAFGYFMSALKQQVCPSISVGIDVSMYAAKRAKDLTGSELVVASSTALPFREGIFDLVTALELLEHLPDIPKHLLDAYRVLANRGVYVASSPNRFGTGRLLEVLRLLHANPTHVKLYTARKLWQHLRAIGFSRPLVRVLQMGLPLPKSRFIAFSFPWPFGSSLLVSGQKTHPKREVLLA